jgi:hypothetical protein
MTNRPSDRQLEMQARAAQERAGVRRTMVWVQTFAAGVLIASTSLVWVNHPRVIHRLGRSPTYFVREVSHSSGLVTRPVGIFAVVLGVLAIVWARQLRNGRTRSGWVALVLALATAAMSSMEVVELLLGRRNWLSNLPTAVQPSLLGQAIGVGVWLAAAASVALVATAVTYLWFAHRVWREVPTLS